MMSHKLFFSVFTDWFVVAFRHQNAVCISFISRLNYIILHLISLSSRNLKLNTNAKVTKIVSPSKDVLWNAFFSDKFLHNSWTTR